MVRDIEPTREPRTLEEAYAALDLHVETLRPDTAEYWAFMDQVTLLEAESVPERTWMSSQQAEHTAERETAIAFAEARMEFHNQKYPNTYPQALQELEGFLEPIERFEVEKATKQATAKHQEMMSRGNVRFSGDPTSNLEREGRDNGFRNMVASLVNKRNEKVPPLPGGTYFPNFAARRLGV